MSDNGADIRTPGGFLLRLGGPLAILALAFGGVVYLGWLDRQALYAQTDRRYQEVHAELRFIRCALRIGMLEPAVRMAVSTHLSSDKDWDRTCKWLELGHSAQPPSKE